MSLQTLLIIWLAFLGGCFGSFLNVVVYRAPRGESLSHPGSRCPACGHAIRPWHNLPVIGWLVLRGKCYDCQANIAIRYPLVEALVAGVFVALALAGPLACAELPENLNAHRVNWNIARWGLYGYHLLGLLLLLAPALIDWDSTKQDDRNSTWRYLWKPTLVVTILGLAIPWLWYPFGFNPPGEILPGRDASSFLSAHAFSSNLGFAIFLIPTWLLWLLAQKKNLPNDRVWLSAASALLVVAYLGYFGGLEVVAAATLLFFLAQILSRSMNSVPHVPLSTFLFLAAFAWLLTSRPGSYYAPEDESVLNEWTYEILGISIFLAWSIALMCQPASRESQEPEN